MKALETTPPSATIVFGDWHSNGWWAEQALAAGCWMVPGASLYHLGDFLLYAGNSHVSYYTALSTVLERYDQVLRIIPGNHDAWPLLQLGTDLFFEFYDYDELNFMISKRWPRLRVSPRVNTWTVNGCRYASLSGANSIDFEIREQLQASWWPEESPLPEHVQQLEELVSGRDVDVLLTHEAPTTAIQDLYPDNDLEWSPSALRYAKQSADVIDTAMRQLQPRTHFCGHHHVRRSVTIGSTNVELVAADESSLKNNCAVLVGETVISPYEYQARWG